MSLPPSIRPPKTYLVECFGKTGVPQPDGGPTDVARGFLATLVVADDEQLLVVVQGSDPAAVTRRCVAAGLTVDRVVEVVLSPAWRWTVTDPAGRRRAQGNLR